jgi:threonine/homoserine/homoserine lactone efflux protein
VELIASATAPLPDTPDLALFLIAATMLIVIPGPAVFYVLARSVAQGPVAGLVSVLGVGVGGLIHVLAAAVGVSAVVMASAAAFTVLKLAGAAYLLYLGIRTLLEPDSPQAVAVARARRLTRVFRDGVVVNALNPKTALFFVAFLPQFVDPGAGSVPQQMALLGLLFVGIGIVSDGVYALLAGGLSLRLQGSRAARRVRRWFSGGVYLGLGVSVALAGGGDSAAPDAR